MVSTSVATMAGWWVVWTDPPMVAHLAEQTADRSVARWVDSWGKWSAVSLADRSVVDLAG